MAKGDKSDKDKTPEPAKGEKEVRIYSLATTVNECIIFLEELQGKRLLPIWIGITEGQAIASAVWKVRDNLNLSLGNAAGDAVHDERPRREARRRRKANGRKRQTPF